MTLRRTLQRSLSTTTRGLSQFGSGGGYDTDAQAYITAVEAADGQSLETGVKDAINAFVVGCKSDGIWTAIKASCILAGARTLTGALVPLVGTAPTNNNFVSGDYDRETGLVGDGATKFILSNRLTTADPQNDFHLSTYATAIGATDGVFIASDDISGTGTLRISGGQSSAIATNGRTFASLTEAFNASAGLVAISRNNLVNYIVRNNGSNVTKTIASQTSLAKPIFIYRRNASSPLYGAHRLSFYSIGESLDLALLDSRVSTLITDIGTALA